jgi:hypothetical protein
MASARLRLGEESRAPDIARRASATPSAAVVVAKVVFVTMLLLLGLTVVATAPLIVVSLLAFVAGVGVLASLGRRPTSRARVRGAARRMRLGGDAGWATLGASSVILLVVALAMPEGYDVALATLGIIGLAVLRLWAMPRPRLGSISRRTTGVALDGALSDRAGRQARDDPTGLRRTRRQRDPIALRPRRPMSLDGPLYA